MLNSAPRQKRYSRAENVDSCLSSIGNAKLHVMCGAVFGMLRILNMML